MSGWISREVNARDITHARLCALATISVICTEHDKSLETITPKSHVCSTTGKLTLSM